MQNEQLIVKYISMKNCFLHLPNVWLKKLSSKNEVIKLINNEIDYYFSYSKTQSSPCNSLCINATFAKCLNIVEGTYLNVSTITHPPIITAIVVTAQSEQDLAIVKLRADKIQQIILHQINVVAKNQSIVLWLSKGLYVTLIVNSIVPNFQYGKLEQYTEVHVMDTIGKAEKSQSPTERKLETVLPIDDANSCSELLNDNTYKILPPIFRVCFVPNSIDLSVNDPFNIDIESEYNIFITLSQSVRICPGNVGTKFLFSNLKILPGNQQRDNKKNTNFIRSANLFEESVEIVVRVIIIENAIKYLQKHNEELLKNMTKLNGDNIIVSGKLRKQLNLELGDKIILTPIVVTDQDITHINIYPSDENVTSDMIQNYFRENFPAKKVLINSGTRISLTDRISCGIQLLPKNCTYTLLHEEKMKDVSICINDVVEVESPDHYPENNYESNENPCHTVCLETMQHTLKKCRTIFSMTLNSLAHCNFICDRENILVCGNIGSGKTTLCQIINEEMQQSPYYFYTRTVDCKKLKGKKVEVISKLLTSIMNDCQYHQPSILFIDGIESITNTSSDEESSPDAINAARIADSIITIVTNYQSTNLINVLATCTNIDKLGDQFRSLRGVNLFRTVMKIPDLSMKNRCDILRATLAHKLNISDTIPWDYYGNKTEGWTPQDIVNLAGKAAFIAWKREIKINNYQSKSPTVTDDDLSTALDHCKPISLDGVTLYSGSGHNWSDIGGLKSVKVALVQLLQWPLIYSGLFKKAPINQQSGVLLYGMPGTGKTMIAGAIAKECGLNFINIKGPELLSKYIGASEEAVRNIFHKAQCAKPCVLFFDEFESLAPRRGHDSTGVTDRVVNQLLTEFDGVEGRVGVAIVAATSRPDLLDPALLRPGRLDKSLLCPLPGECERLQILEALCKTHNIDDNELDLQMLAGKSVNFTGADLNAILTQARMNAFEKNSQLSWNGNLRTIEEMKVTQDDLLVSLETTQPSLTIAEIRKFHKIYNKFSKDDGFPEELLNLKSTLV